MKVLVTGGTGFVGSHLIDRLLEDPDVEIYALVRNPAKAPWPRDIRRLHLLTGDLLNIPSLPAGLSAVVHLAGQTKAFKSSRYYTVNQAGTASLIRALAARAETPKFIQVSSQAAAGPSTKGRPVREGDTPRPLSPYGLSKLAAEEEVLKFAVRFPVVILRPGAIYGPRDEDFLEFFRWVNKGVLPLFGPAGQCLSLCYVGDVVRAVLVAVKSEVPSGEIFNIASAQPTSWRELGRAAAAVLGRRVRLVRIPGWSVFMAAVAAEGLGRMRQRPTAVNLSKYKDMKAEEWVMDVRKARDMLGFEALTALEDGLKETLGWYLLHGKL